MKNTFRQTLCTLCAGVLLTSAAVPAAAVTREEFEKARVIAATAYVRYTNPGSGYLDDNRPTTMAELESMVKGHEKDAKNLSDFKAKSTPSDYETWDKDKLKSYWSSEFFSGSGLSTEASSSRKAKIQAGIGAMSVTPPSAQPQGDESVRTDTVRQQQQTTTPANDFPEGLTSVTDVTDNQDTAAVDTAGTGTEIIEEANDSSSSTWLYILILIALVVVVIWLVWYAMKVMREGNGKNNDDDDDNDVPTRRNAVRSQHTQPVQHQPIRPIDVDDETFRQSPSLQPYQQQPPRDETLRRMAVELEAHRQAEERLRAENERLTRELSRLQRNATVVAPGPAEKVSETRTIFLGRANRDNIFVRADRQYVPGKTIYKLVTDNGFTGTFHVIDTPETVRSVEVDPRTMLANGCEVATFATTGDMRSIVTDTAGTAIFEDSCWKVIRPAAVHFE